MAGQDTRHTAVPLYTNAILLVLSPLPPSPYMRGVATDWRPGGVASRRATYRARPWCVTTVVCYATNMYGCATPRRYFAFEDFCGRTLRLRCGTFYTNSRHYLYAVRSPPLAFTRWTWFPETPALPRAVAVSPLSAIYIRMPLFFYSILYAFYYLACRCWRVTLCFCHRPAMSVNGAAGARASFMRYIFTPLPLCSARAARSARVWIHMPGGTYAACCQLLRLLSASLLPYIPLTLLFCLPSLCLPSPFLLRAFPCPAFTYNFGVLSPIFPGARRLTPSSLALYYIILWRTLYAISSLLPFWRGR